MQCEVVKLPEIKKGFVLLLEHWVVKRSNAWAARFRCLVQDYEWLAGTLKGLHTVEEPTKPVAIPSAAGISSPTVVAERQSALHVR